MACENVSWGFTVRLWWAYTWRALFWGVGIAFLTMFTISFFLIQQGLSKEQFINVLVWANLPLFLLGIFVQIW